MSVVTKKFGSDSNNRIYVRLDTGPLKAIERELGKQFVAQVGILGGKTNRESIKSGESSSQYRARVKRIRKQKEESSGFSGMSNADIGLIHEKGSPARNIPRRSFIEMPLTTKMPALMQKVGEALLKGINAGNIEEAYKKLGIFGVGQIQQAFPTGGFGLWPALKKGEESHLIDTGQLKNSISSRVVTV